MNPRRPNPPVRTGNPQGPPRRTGNPQGPPRRAEIPGPAPQPLTASTPAVGQAVLTQALSWPDKARAVVITDPDSYVRAAELLKGIKALQKEADATFDPIISAANKTHQEACAQKRKVNEPLATAEREIKNRMVAYDQDQERIRIQRQREADAAAKAAADAEALDLAAALEREGKGWGDQGLIAQANQIVEERIQAAPPPIPLVPKAVPRVSGIARKTIWTGVCVDLKQFLVYAATHPEHMHVLKIDQTALNNLARGMREGLNTIPGLRAVETPDIAAGSR